MKVSILGSLLFTTLSLPCFANADVLKTTIQNLENDLVVKCEYSESSPMCLININCTSVSTYTCADQSGKVKAIVKAKYNAGHAGEYFEVRELINLNIALK